MRSQREAAIGDATQSGGATSRGSGAERPFI